MPTLSNWSVAMERRTNTIRSRFFHPSIHTVPSYALKLAFYAELYFFLFVSFVISVRVCASNKVLNLMGQNIARYAVRFTHTRQLLCIYTHVGQAQTSIWGAQTHGSLFIDQIVSVVVFYLPILFELPFGSFFCSSSLPTRVYFLIEAEFICGDQYWRMSKRNSPKFAFVQYS